MTSKEPEAPRRKVSLRTWIGLLLIAAAVVLGGIAGLILERLTAPR